VKEIDVEILTNLNVFRFQGSKKSLSKFRVYSELRNLHSVTVAGDESTSGIKMKLWT